MVRGTVTEGTVLYALEQKLRRERARLWEEAMAAESEIHSLAEERQIEIEEASQQEQLAGQLERLDQRTRHAIEEIDAALMRLAESRYGSCQTCGRRIAIARLEALPATRFCVRCADSTAH